MAKTIENDKKHKVIKKFKLASKDPSKVDLSDIKEMTEKHKNGDKSMDIVHLEFEQVDHNENDDKTK